MIEASPRPGEFPTGAMDLLLPGCAAAVVASSTLINRSAPRILRLAHGSRLALVGPVTPLSPRLYHYGAEILGGLVVHDAAGLAGAVRAGAMPREFRAGVWCKVASGQTHRHYADAGKARPAARNSRRVSSDADRDNSPHFDGLRGKEPRLRTESRLPANCTRSGRGRERRLWERRPG